MPEHTHPHPDPELVNGLATYKLGEGEPVFLMPSPDGFTFTRSARSPLALQLLALGRQVITFDPSGAYLSTRPAQVSLEDLLASTSEVLQAARLSQPVDFAGEGVGALGALAFALETPMQVKSLALVGACASQASLRSNGGLPWCLSRTSPDFWRYTTWERRLSRGGGSMALHKRLMELISQQAFAHPEHALPVKIKDGDDQKMPPARDRWRRLTRRLDLNSTSRQIQVPVLLCVGRQDRLAPVGCSHELAELLHASWLMVFEKSGHFPQLEEPDAMQAVLAEFWQA